MNDKIVAIIGTREPDRVQIGKARRLASDLSKLHGCIISTGGAFGIDQMAMEGAEPSKLLVFLPWASYNADIIPAGCMKVIASETKHSIWFESVKLYHPAPDRLSRGARALHARNYGIIADASIVIAFPGEGGQGGTGQGIRIAKALGIPVLQFNRGDDHIPLYNDLLEMVLDQLTLTISPADVAA